MAWRAFVDEQTPEGLHIIFTNDDSLDETTIRAPWDAPEKQRANPALRRFGKVARLATQDEVAAFCAAEIARLEATETPVSIGSFVTPVVAAEPDPKQAAERALSEALSAYERAVRVAEADPSFDLTKYKQAVVSAQSAIVGK